MKLRRLVFREIAHRKGSFFLAVASVSIAVAALVGSIVSLKGHDLRTEQILSETEADTNRILDEKLVATEARLKALEDDYRKITKRMGYNVLVLPKSVNLADFHADDFASQYMPEEFADRLANSRIVTVNHLLPSLTQKIRWPEQKRTIILIGTKGQVPIAHRDPKKPIESGVAKGSIVLGHELGERLGLSVGDETALLDTKFKVAKIHKARGTKDDITAWIHLSQAQELLEKDGQINGIRALECNCPGDPDQRLTVIRNEIQKILPETQIVSYQTKAVARVDARRRAEREAKQGLEAEKLSIANLLETLRGKRQALRGEQAELAATLAPLAVLVSCVWISFLALGNARDRRAEVGILRAIGLRSAAILKVFLARAVLIGCVGSVAGYVLGLSGGALWGDLQVSESLRLFDPLLFFGVLVVAPFLSILATWIPAYSSAQRDPALILQRDV